MADRIGIVEHSDFGLATVMARRGIAPAAIGAALGVDLGSCLSRAVDADLLLAATGPDTWLAYAQHPPARWADDLRERLVGFASVSDQSGGYMLYRVTGTDARKVLQRGIAIDLHPEVFGRGCVAATVIAHVSVVIWQIDATPTFDVAVFRSFAGSFRHWVDTAVLAL